MAAGIGKGFDTKETFLAHGVVKFGTRHGVSQRDLNRLAVEFFRKVDGFFDGFLGFAGQDR